MNLIQSGVLRTFLTSSFLLVFCLLHAQDAPVVWTDQKKTIVEDYWFPEGEERALWQTRIIYHDETGRDTLAVLEGEEDQQVVRFKYDDRGDLIARTHIFPDSTIETYRWERTYDDQDRLVDRKSYDAADKLLSQEIVVYDSLGRITDHAYFCKRDLRFQAWSFRDDEDGYKVDNPLYIRLGSRNFYNDWEKRRFALTLTPFSLIPSDDVFQRWSYKYNKTGKVIGTTLYDQTRRESQVNEYRYSGKNLRTIVSNDHADSISRAWDFKYDELGNIAASRYMDVSAGKVVPLWEGEIMTKGGEVVQRVSKKLGVEFDFYYYSQNKLKKRERKDMFSQLMWSITYRTDGLIDFQKIYNQKQELEIERIYSYE